MLLVDHQIKALALQGMIEPFIDHQVRDGVISYGLGSTGYDIRVANEWMRVPDGISHTFDPKNPRKDWWENVVSDSEFPLRPGHFILGRSLEYIRMPRDVVGVVLTKSTYARTGIFCNITPLEGGWEGTITIEIANLGHNSVYIYPNEGIAQILFFKTDEQCDVSYADRKGKYQGQTGVTLGKV